MWSDNYDIWEIFLDIASQVRAGGMGGFIGFDYGALEFILNAHEVPKYEWRVILMKLNVISSVAVKRWNADTGQSKIKNRNTKPSMPAKR